MSCKKVFCLSDSIVINIILENTENATKNINFYPVFAHFKNFILLRLFAASGIILTMVNLLFLTTDFNAEIAEQTLAAILKARERMEFRMDIFSCFGGSREESGDLGEYAMHSVPVYKKYDGEEYED